MPRPPVIAAGERFGRLVVVREMAERYSDGRRLWECRCDCGEVRVIPTGSLRRGLSRSCGCLQRELTAERGRASTRHGHYAGDVESPTLASWRAMRKRCYSPRNASYADYGARGIIVCDRWRESFPTFLADMGERPDGTTLDRIDNSGNYEPGNCRWATASEQSNNRRPKRSSGRRSTNVTKTSSDARFVIPRGVPVHSTKTGEWATSGKTLTVRPDSVKTYGEAGMVVTWAGKASYWRSVRILPDGSYAASWPS